MKLRKGDTVLVIAGKDKGKTGKVLSIMPATNLVVVEGINIAKRHTKPSNKVPRGGILEITKGVNASKLMVLDPESGKPARIGYTITKTGVKERIFKVSPNAVKPKSSKSEVTKAESKAQPAKATKPAAKTTKSSKATTEAKEKKS